MDEDGVRHVKVPSTPADPSAAVLTAYSRAGGTHHSALVLGDRVEALQAFARFCGLACTVIKGG